MSNKAKKDGLVPRLRFPEFLGAGEWALEELGKLCEICTGKKDANEGSPDGQYPFFTCADQHGYSHAYSFDAEAILIAGNANVGQTKYYKGKFEAYQRTYVLTGFRGINVAYLYTILSAKLQTSLLEQVQTSAMSYIRLPMLTQYKLALPSHKSEQQRIADCLTSLDELITLEAQKLVTLKTHKKGLMQQLFPAEGETLPKLRFPEFREAGEWEEKRLGDVGSVRMCKRIFKEQTSPHGDIPFYKIGTFGGVPDAYISRQVFDNYKNNYPFPRKGSVLISAAGTIGRTIIYSGELAYFQDSNIVWLDNNEKLIADNFLFYVYQLINWAPSVGAIQRLYNENILGIQVKFPSISEQQKIADCLASLDDLITTQTQNLATLKTHKKGLMQQLFPSLDEAAA